MTNMLKSERRRGFSLIEMLVVILVITALISIVLIAGRSVLISTRISLTQTELRNLQASLDVLKHKTNQQPTDMPTFLTEYQWLYAYQDTNGNWHEHPNSLTNMPANLLSIGTINRPGGGSMQGIVAINDAFGNAIQFIPYNVQNPQHTPCFVSAGPDGIFGESDMLYSYNP
ncbi:MAG: type II secretion system protein [Phycisphaerae bacterium]